MLFLLYCFGGHVNVFGRVCVQEGARNHGEDDLDEAHAAAHRVSGVPPVGLRTHRRHQLGHQTEEHLPGATGKVSVLKPVLKHLYFTGYGMLHRQWTILNGLLNLPSKNDI